MAPRGHRKKGCSCEWCERSREAVRRWARSEAGRAYHHAYKRTERYKAQQAAYAKLPRVREAAKGIKARYRATDRGKEARRRDERARYARPVDREKMSARRAVYKAKKRGRLIVPSACPNCAGPGPLEAHHYMGYAREHRLDVVFLCRDCHRAAEAEG